MGVSENVGFPLKPSFAEVLPATMRNAPRVDARYAPCARERPKTSDPVRKHPSQTILTDTYASFARLYRRRPFLPRTSANSSRSCAGSCFMAAAPALLLECLLWLPPTSYSTVTVEMGTVIHKIVRRLFFPRMIGGILAPHICKDLCPVAIDKRIIGQELA